ncbi:two-component system response regulator [Oceaniserpentilla sp. 4NH20-0058]|uniref:HD domain-containing phosphohydrolase n=1 Tax=Oceaniserpentilla sp. 4NH20-0058 TaxID=3127660 RepID=UPI003108046E
MTDTAKILFVDDEPQMLTALSRVFRGKQFDVHTANSGQEALAILENSQFDVIVSDMRMPEMDGATFLSHSIKLNPQSRRILLTGYSDQESTIRAINDGQVHQYLSKPWDNQSLRETVEAEIIEKQRIEAETPDQAEHQALQNQVISVSNELKHATVLADMAKGELLNQYNTTIKVMSNLIHMRVPTPKDMNKDVVSHCVALAKLIKLDSKIITEIRNAARLYQLGKINFPETLLNQPLQDMTKDMLAQYQQHPLQGADLLTPLTSMDFTAKLIRHQNENYNGSGLPEKLSKNKIPLGSRILRIVIDYQQMIHGIYLKDVLSHNDALELLEKSSGTKYDPELVKLYKKLILEISKHKTTESDKLIPIDEIQPGDKVNRDVFSPDGILLIAKGMDMTPTLINKLTLIEARYKKTLNIFIKTLEPAD